MHLDSVFRFGIIGRYFFIGMVCILRKENSYVRRIFRYYYVSLVGTYYPYQRSKLDSTAIRKLEGPPLLFFDDDDGGKEKTTTASAARADNIQA